MATIDAFSAQIVDMVRRMPAEAILALVKNQLGAVTGALGMGELGPKRRGRPPKALSLSASSQANGRGAGRRGAGKRTTAARGPGRGRKRARSADREQSLAQIEEIVKSSQGLSASEVAKKANEAQSRVAALLKDLKTQKRIFQGGDRRFARYAGDAKQAEAASIASRQNAKGPNGAKKPPRKRSRAA